MPRKYVSKGLVTPIDCNKLVNAIKLVKNDAKTARSASVSYGINYRTLNRYIKRVDERFPSFFNVTDEELFAFLREKSTLGARPLFTDLQEQALADYISKFSKMNYGLTINNIRCLAYKYAKKCDVEYPNSWSHSQKASKDWYYGYMKRHPNLSLRKPDSTSSNRAKGICKENVDESIHLTSVNHGNNYRTLSRNIKREDEIFPSFSNVADDELFAFSKEKSSLGVKPLFTDLQEQALTDYIIQYSKMNYGLTINNIRCLAYEYAKKCDVEYPSSWGHSQKASKDWYYGYMKHHPNLSLHKPESFCSNRAKGFCKENVVEFFHNYKNVLAEHKFEANRIWNLDEMCFATVPMEVVKVVAHEGSSVAQMTFAEHGTNVTMAMAVSGTGQSIPPFFIYPRKNMENTFLYNASPGSVGYANGSGWMTASDFIKYMQHFIIHTNVSKNNPLLLLFDNHSTHTTIECIDLAVENGISIVTIPLLCSRRLQPLDVAVFGPIKQFYTSLVDDWIKSHGGRLFEIEHVAEVAEKAMELGLIPKNIRSGFAATGISPLNSSIFTEGDFYAAQISGENEAADEHVSVNDEHQVLIVFDEINPLDAIGEVTTSNSELTSISNPSTSPSLHTTLDEIDPIKVVAPTPKSNRSRKGMKGAILTSPSTSSSSSADDQDFCMICGELLPKKLNRNNSIKCNKCDFPYHLKCVNMENRSYFTCHNCDSELDVSD